LARCMTLATISVGLTVAKGQGIIVKIIHPVICCIALALTAGASAAPAAEDDFPLNGSYTIPSATAKALTHILNAGFPSGRSSATSPSPYSPTIRSNSLIATRTIARSFIAVRSNRPEVPPRATPSHSAGHRLCCRASPVSVRLGRRRTSPSCRRLRRL
jgi:hypothetical protein